MYKLKHSLSSRHTKAFEKFKNDPSEANMKAKLSFVQHIEALDLKIYEAFVDNYTAQSDKIRKSYYNYGVNQNIILRKVKNIF